MNGCARVLLPQLLGALISQSIDTRTSLFMLHEEHGRLPRTSERYELEFAHCKVKTTKVSHFVLSFILHSPVDTLLQCIDCMEDAGTGRYELLSGQPNSQLAILSVHNANQDWSCVFSARGVEQALFTTRNALIGNVRRG